MKHTLPILIALPFLSLLAANPPGVVYWPKGTPPAAGPKTAKFENHALSVSHRDKSGVAEFHENQTDIFVVESGEATIEVGGELINPKTESPGELRGSSIRNGVKFHLSAGDVIHIPFKTPHQFFLAPGKQITYFVVKVNKP